MSETPKRVFLLSNRDIEVIGAALGDAPYRMAKPIVDSLNAQLAAYVAADLAPAATDAPKVDPAAPEAPAATDSAAAT